MTASKIVAAAASGVGGAGLDVDEVFSTFLYTGNATTRNIQNGVDLTEGGLVWTKCRNATDGHQLYDTERGVTKRLKSESSDAEGTDTNEVTAFNSNGYTLNQDGGGTNGNGNTYVSWTWRKAPKFFDVVTYTGTGSAQNISHNLGSVPGMILVKKTNASTAWTIFHRSLGATKYLLFNTSDAGTQTARWNDTEPTSTQFTVGTSGGTNDNGDTYIAYLFAHNNSDGEFGPDGDQDIIKCGSYTGNGSSTGPVVTLGFEPGFILLKRTDDPENANWFAFDSLRGITTGGDDPYLYWNTTAAEVAGNALEVTSTGFQLKSTSSGFNGSSASYVYMAIRRGPLAAPTDATKVFHVNQQNNADTFSVGFPTDLALVAKTGGSSSNAVVGSRLTGDDKFLVTSGTDAEASSSSIFTFDLQNSFKQGFSTSAENVSWLWGRAPSYFDCICYSGTGSNRTVSHNLGAVPEMMWIKCRSNTDNWAVFHKDTGATKVIFLNNDIAASTLSTRFNDTAPTSSVFTVGTDAEVNGSGRTYIAYLFASVDGVSKVGSYTGNGASTQTIDCGFSSGARFVLLKRTDATDEWYVFDSVRGIVSGNDPFLMINTTNAEVSNQDLIEPHSSGFIINNWANGSGSSWIFYAIA